MFGCVDGYGMHEAFYHYGSSPVISMRARGKKQSPKNTGIFGSSGAQNTATKGANGLSRLQKVETISIIWACFHAHGIHHFPNNLHKASWYVVRVLG